jgi:hypothetical protein
MWCSDLGLTNLDTAVSSCHYGDRRRIFGNTRESSLIVIECFHYLRHISLDRHQRCLQLIARKLSLILRLGSCFYFYGLTGLLNTVFKISF